MFKLSQSKESNEFLGFIVDGEKFCINVLQLQEIIYIPSISRIPNVPNFIEGAIDLRGKIIRVINLRKWMRLSWQFFNEKSRILIISGIDGVFGLLVDEVLEVFQIQKGQQHEMPPIFQQESDIVYTKSVIIQNNEIFIEINPEIIKMENT
jgi:purine-binding chemotaxis protein CheW